MNLVFYFISHVTPIIFEMDSKISLFKKAIVVMKLIHFRLKEMPKFNILTNKMFSIRNMKKVNTTTVLAFTCIVKKPY